MSTSLKDPGADDSEFLPTRASLLARLKDLGNDQSWQEFFNTYRRIIYRRVLNSGLPAQDADEVVMEVVEGVARRMPEFVYKPDECEFKTWLFRILQFRVADHFRRRRRGLGRLAPIPDGMATLEQMPDPATSLPDQKWEEEWETNLLQAAMERVRQRGNPHDLQIFLYSTQESRSVAETAAHLGVTPEAVSQAKHRVKKMLQAEVERLRQKHDFQ